MATHVANAAGEDVDFALNTIRQGDRFIDKLPGIRSSASNLAQSGANQQRRGSRLFNRPGSGSSGSSGQRGGPGGLRFNNQLRTRVLSGRTNTGRMASLSYMWSLQADQRSDSVPVGTPQVWANQNQRSQLPVIGGGTRQNANFDVNVGPTYRSSPMARHSVGASIDSRTMNFEVSGGKAKGTGLNSVGYLQN